MSLGNQKDGHSDNRDLETKDGFGREETKY